MKTTLKEAVSEILGRKAGIKEAMNFSNENYLDLVRFIRHEQKLEIMKENLNNERLRKQEQFRNKRLPLNKCPNCRVKLGTGIHKCKYDMN